MELDNARIYVQMKPDDDAVAALRRIGEALPLQTSGRLLPPEELHITLIHFGKARDVLAAVRRMTDIGDETYMRHLDAYADETGALLTDDAYDLVPRGYARFGAHGTTLVGRYDAPAELHEIHARAYGVLLRFLGACGIADAEAFARDDPNFTHARTFSPHATIYKGYDGPDPNAPLPDMHARFMMLRYSSRTD